MASDAFTLSIMAYKRGAVHKAAGGGPPVPQISKQHTPSHAYREHTQDIAHTEKHPKTVPQISKQHTLYRYHTGTVICFEI